MALRTVLMAAMKKTAVSTCLLPSESVLFFLSANHRQEAQEVREPEWSVLFFFLSQNLLVASNFDSVNNSQICLNRKCKLQYSSQKSLFNLSVVRCRHCLLWLVTGRIFMVGSASQMRVLQKNDCLYNKQFKSGGRVTSNFFANRCISEWQDGLTKAGKVSPAFISVLVVSSFHSHIHKHCILFISMFSIFSSSLHLFIYLFSQAKWSFLQWSFPSDWF